MKRILFLAFVLIGTALNAEEIPPFEVKDPATMENFRRIFSLMSQHNHNDPDSSPVESDAVSFSTYIAGPVAIASHTAVNRSSASLTSSFVINGGMVWAAVYKTSSYIMQFASESVIIADSSGGSISITLPAEIEVGRIIFIYRSITDTSANTITISPPAGNTINGAASKAIAGEPSGFILFRQDGTRWICWNLAPS